MKPPSVVVPGLNRGIGVPAGYVLGRLPGTGHGPAQLLSLTHLKQMGLAATASISTTYVPNTRQIHTTSPVLGGGPLSSDLTLSHAASGVTAGTYGDGTHVPQFTVDADGHVTGVTEVAITGGGGGGTTTDALTFDVTGGAAPGASFDGSAAIAVDYHTVGAPSVADMNAAIAAATGSGGTIPDGVVSGCGVAYSGTGLTFNMSAGSFYLDNTLYSASAQSVTLATADATNPRIDVLYVDTSGTFGKITGTAAANPSQPSVDSSSQLYLTFVLVPAAATSLSGITNETIYDEGTEWTPTASGSGFTVNSTNNPYSGTKCIEGTSVTAGSYVKFVRSSSESFDGSGNLTLEIRSKATWNSKRWLTLQWYLAGVAKGSPVNLKSGTFGFDSSQTTSYQLIVIPKTQFAIPSGTNVDELRVTDAGGSIGFYLDDIILQNTGTTSGGGGTTSGITQDQADARYFQITKNLSEGTASTIRTNIGATTVGANLFRLTNPSAITFLRVNADNSVSALSASAFRTAIGAGTGGGDLVSTNNLSDVANTSTARTNLGLLRIVPFFFTTTPASSEVMAIYAAVDAFTIPANMSGSQVKVGTNPAATFAMDVQQNGTSIGTISISTGGTPTLTTTSGTSKSIAAGDVLEFVAPSTADTTIANVAVNIKGTL